jgi:hypothetical protein
MSDFWYNEMLKRHERSINIIKNEGRGDIGKLRPYILDGLNGGLPPLSLLTELGVSNPYPISIGQHRLHRNTVLTKAEIKHEKLQRHLEYAEEARQYT